jgi:hypothetical protein
LCLRAGRCKLEGSKKSKNEFRGNVSTQHHTSNLERRPQEAKRGVTEGQKPEKKSGSEFHRESQIVQLVLAL